MDSLSVSLIKSPWNPKFFLIGNYLIELSRA